VRIGESPPLRMVKVVEEDVVLPTEPLTTVQLRKAAPGLLEYRLTKETG